MTTIYGLIYEHVADEGIARTAAAYIVPLHVIEVVQNVANSAHGMCLMKVIFTLESPVPALGISTAQKLSFGRDVQLATPLRTLLPHSTGPHHGFRDIETGRIVGNGRFFATLAEAEQSAQHEDGEVINLARVG